MQVEQAGTLAAIYTVEWNKRQFGDRTREAGSMVVMTLVTDFEEKPIDVVLGDEVSPAEVHRMGPGTPVKVSLEIGARARGNFGEVTYTARKVVAVQSAAAKTA